MALSDSRTLPLRYENIADQADPRQLSLISMVTACKRVGHLYDCWQTCPGQIRRFLSDSESDPLRALLLLEPDSLSRKETSSVGAGVKCFNVGDTIKARLPGPIKDKYNSIRATCKDGGREWHRAIISDIAGDGKFKIKWQDGYIDDNDLDIFEVDAQEVIAADDGTSHTNGADVFLREQKNKLQRAAVRILFFFAVMTLPGELMMHGQPLCRRIEGKVASAICSAQELQSNPRLFAFVDEHFGFCVSWTSLGLCFVAKFCLAPFCFLLLRLWSSSLERRARRTTIVLCFDYIFLQLLPQLHGKTELMCCFVYFQILLSGAIIAAITQKPGIFPFAHMIAAIVMRFANGAFGENSGLQDLRKTWLLRVLEKQLQVSDCELTKEMLRDELNRFLNTSPDTNVITIGLPFLTLLASCIRVHAPDSIRLQHFIVPDAYAEFTHAPEKMANLNFRRDVNVDVFSETCAVPGVNLTGERWQEQGFLLPWHLALNFAQVRAHEMRLRLRGMPAGHGCFTWRSTRNKKAIWAAREAQNIDRKIAKAKQLTAHFRALDEEFNALTLQDDLNVDALRAFLRAGADPDFVPNHVKESGLCRALRKGNLSPEVLDILVSDSSKRETRFSFLNDRAIATSQASSCESV